MKNFVFNTALGKRFFAEFINFVQSNGFDCCYDYYDSIFIVTFEEYLSLSNDALCQLNFLAYRFDLLLEFRAESDCLIVEFSLN